MSEASQTQHTLQDWRVHFYPDSDQPYAICIGDDLSKKICDVRGWGYLIGSGGLDLPAEEAAKIQTQWAHLLSAAPNLLEALEALDASWTETFPEGPDFEYANSIAIADEHKAIWKQIRAAIAKARP